MSVKLIATFQKKLNVVCAASLFAGQRGTGVWPIV